MQHYDDLCTCLYTDILERELRDEKRIVVETPRFVVFEPFASAAPFETWIMPRQTEPSFGAATDPSRPEHTAVALRPLVRRELHS
jgi:UDPglucose--hexose-1-phosphate uridylyltransferase